MTHQAYIEHLNRLPISQHTRRNYALRVKKFLNWLADTIEGSAALSNETDRDFAVRDYQVHLLQSGLSPSTVNAHAAALDNFFQSIGLGPTRLRRQELPKESPKALEPEEVRRLMKTISRCESTRNKAIASVMLYSGLRVSEVASLNVGDIFVTARKGEITVRCGKNSKHRKVPMSPDLREVIQAFMSRPRDPQEPLFKSQKGNRLSKNAIDHLIRQLARDAGVEMSCHSLRHTCFSKMLRQGFDIVLVAEIAGHSRLETTRRYSLPSANDKIAAMEKLTYAAQT